MSFSSVWVIPLLILSLGHKYQLCAFLFVLLLTFVLCVPFFSVCFSVSVGFGLRPAAVSRSF